MSGETTMAAMPFARALTRTLSAAAVLLALTTTAQAATDVRLYGALVAEPCVVAPGSEDIQLAFGTIVDKYLYLNTRTLGQNLDIQLAECDVTLGRTVKVTFLGTESTQLPGLLALDGGSEAAGIAIGLETPNAKPLPVNKASDDIALQDGNSVIALKAYVQGEPEAITNRSITRGAFTATATFSLEYE